MITEEKLKAIEERAAKATLGRWEHRGHFETSVEDSQGNVIAHVYSTPALNARDQIHRAYDSAGFIAHARTDVPALVAEVRRLRAALERLVNDTSIESQGCDCPEIAREALSGGGSG